DQARARLSQQMAQYSLMLSVSGTTSSSGSGGGPQVTDAAMGMLQQLLAQASTEQAEGRVVVHFSSLEQLAGSSQDLVLSDQDSINIPRRPSSVAVLGQVNNPTAMIAQPNVTVGEYLYRAGGPTKNGDLDQLMVIKADGSVVTADGLKYGRRASLFPLY